MKKDIWNDFAINPSREENNYRTGKIGFLLVSLGIIVDSLIIIYFF